MEYLVFIDDVSPKFDLPALSRKLDIKEGQTRRAKRLAELADKVLEVARPRAFAMLCPVEVLDQNRVKVAHVEMPSPLLSAKFEGLGRVFPYLATEGRELHEWGETLTAATDHFYVSALRHEVCKQCQAQLERKIQREFGIPDVSCLQPIYPRQWPLEQMYELFLLFGTNANMIGVHLLPSLFLSPPFSVSGIYFQADKSYANCVLCPREDCPHRMLRPQLGSLSDEAPAAQQGQSRA